MSPLNLSLGFGFLSKVSKTHQIESRRLPVYAGKLLAIFKSERQKREDLSIRASTQPKNLWQTPDSKMYRGNYHFQINLSIGPKEPFPGEVQIKQSQAMTLAIA
jgi:hypothetical protein